MNDFDCLALDGRLLQQFIAVYDAGSVTAAAEKLTQPNISHSLERLGKLTGKKLFARQGRGIVATEHGHQLAPEVRQVLTQMAGLLVQRDYQPALDEGTFVIACNDYEREVLVKPLFKRLQQQAPLCRLQLLPLGGRGEIVAALRKHRIDLALSPTVTQDTSELSQQLLFSDHTICFYPQEQPPPESLDHHLAARHIRVSFSQQKQNLIDDWLAKRNLARHTALIVPSFDAVASFMQEAPLVATLPSMLGVSSLGQFARCPSPIPVPDLEVYQLWHQQHQASPRHQWLRAQVKQLAGALG